MAPQPLHLPKSLFTITEDNVPVSSCQQQPQQEYEDYSVPLSSSTSAATLKLSKSSSSSSSTSTSTSTSRSNRTGSTSLKRNLRLLSNVLDVLDNNPTSTSAATTLDEKFDATFARWDANAPSSSILGSFNRSGGDPPPTRPLRRLHQVEFIAKSA